MSESRYHQTSKAPAIPKADRKTEEVSPGLHVPYTLPTDSTGEPIGVQNPSPEDDGSVYAYQVDVENSDTLEFSGEVIDLFDDFNSVNIAPAGTNPKRILIRLHRPVISSLVGIGSPNTSLKNAKLILRGLDGEEVRTPVDLSADNTPRGVIFFPFEQTGFIEMELQFYTDDEVTIGGCAVFESKHVTISGIQGLFSPAAQIDRIFDADEEWVSEIIDTNNYVWVIGSATSDQDSAVNGYVIEFCPDKTFADYKTFDAPYTVGAGRKKTFSEQPVTRYLRIRYKNGPIQALVVVSTSLKPVPSKASSHKINDSIDGEDDAELTKSINTAFSEVTGGSENITSFRRALQVDNALVHRAGVSQLFTKIGTSSTTLAAQAAVGATDIDVVSAAAFSIGDQIILNSELFHFHITDIVANNIQLDRPIDNILPIGTTMQDVTNNMGVVGSLIAPVSFKVFPPADEIWQLTRIIPGMTATTAMDDGKFGGIAALTNGAVLRAYRGGQFRTGAVWKTNGDMALDMYNLDYTDKAPAGQNGLRGRWTFTNAEFIVELDGATGDYAEILIQDDNSANSGYYIKAQGRIFGA